MPPGLIKLKFGAEFNQSIDKLPKTLTNLTLGSQFDKPLNHIPYSVTHLSVHSDILLTTFIPEQNITHLTVTDNVLPYDKKINGADLRIICGGIPCVQTYPISKLPSSVTHLKINHKTTQIKSS